LLLGLLLLLGGCLGAEPPRITSRTGEVHLHQYATGAHIEALFVDPATPVEQTEFDSTLPTRNPPFLEVDGCKVYDFGGCTGACRAPTLVDGGSVAIEGLPQAIELGYESQSGGYDNLILDGAVLTGGTVARVHGEGRGNIPSFSAEIVVPSTISPTTTLESGLSGGLELAWSSAGDGSHVKLVLNVVPADGTTVAIACYLDDTLGRFRLPDEALARLGPAPRTVQLEVSRYRLVDVPLGDGRAVVLHSGNSVLSATMEQ